MIMLSRPAGRPVWLLATLLGTLTLSIPAQPQTPADATQAVADQLRQLSREQQADLELDRQLQSLRQQQQQLVLQLDNQQIYNAHLQRLLQNQEQQSRANQAQLESIGATEQQLIPLMYRMIADLQRYIEQDLPLQRELRLSRIADLQQMMGQDRLDNPQKLRRVLETYQIELAYNRQFNLARDQLEIDGEARHVELLAVGKLGLFARSPDHHNYWQWRQLTADWQALGAEDREPLASAFAIAADLQPAELLTLPLELDALPQQEAHP